MSRQSFWFLRVSTNADSPEQLIEKVLEWYFFENFNQTRFRSVPFKTDVNHVAHFQTSMDPLTRLGMLCFFLAIRDDTSHFIEWSMFRLSESLIKHDADVKDEDYKKISSPEQGICGPKAFLTSSCPRRKREKEHFHVFKANSALKTTIALGCI